MQAGDRLAERHPLRGTVSGGKIQFQSQPRYNSDATRPSVALTDDGFVTEVHDDRDADRDLGRTVGRLSASDNAMSASQRAS